jgi:ATP synthase F1 gamma subunit
LRGSQGPRSSARASTAKISSHGRKRGQKTVEFVDAQELTAKLCGFYGEGSFDVAYVLYNKFRSANSQIVTLKQLIPFVASAEAEKKEAAGAQALFECLNFAADSLEQAFAAQSGNPDFHRFARKRGGEQGARMTAMDNATRNAGDMIRSLDAKLQPFAPSLYHQGADRNHLRRRSFVIIASGTLKETGETKMTAKIASGRPYHPSHGCRR